MRDELIDKLMVMMMRHGVEDDGLKNELVILLNDYEITTRETAVAVRNEDVNRYYLEKFIIAKTVKGLSDKTLRYYHQVLERTLSMIGKTIPEITTDDILYYLAIREKRDKVTKTTLNNERRVLSTFYTYLHGEELVTRNPMLRIEKIKCRKKKMNAFTEMDVEKLRAGCKNAKERAIVEVMLSTGCRVSELCEIKISDIAPEGSLIVHGKGDKDRTVYLNAKAQLAVETYLAERPDDNPYLLPKMLNAKQMSRSAVRNAYRRKENILPDGCMDKSSVEQLTRRLGKRCGVTDCHPHRFRRTCATFALRRGMPIEQVSKMLGHEQLTTTQIYLDLDEKDLEAAHRKYVI